MTKAEIRDFKTYVKQALVKKYHMNDLEAHRAVRDSYMVIALNKDSDYVMHDTVEEWADFIYHEIIREEKLRM